MFVQSAFRFTMTTMTIVTFRPFRTRSESCLHITGDRKDTGCARCAPWSTMSWTQRGLDAATDGLGGLAPSPCCPCLEEASVPWPLFLHFLSAFGLIGVPHCWTHFDIFGGFTHFTHLNGLFLKLLQAFFPLLLSQLAALKCVEVTSQSIKVPGRKRLQSSASDQIPSPPVPVDSVDLR